jgi:hypothetical protein
MMIVTLPPLEATRLSAFSDRFQAGAGLKIESNGHINIKREAEFKLKKGVCNYSVIDSGYRG